MKNYGRLDINDVDCEHINIGGKNVNYSANTLLYEDVDKVILNSSGNGLFLVNSESYILDNSVQFNSKYTFNNNTNQNSITFNSMYSQLNDGMLAINHIIDDINEYEYDIHNQNYTKMLVGKNNMSDSKYIFGNSIKYIKDDDNNNYIFGNNFNTYSYPTNCSYILSNKKQNKPAVLIDESLFINNENMNIVFTTGGLKIIEDDDDNTLVKNNKLLQRNNGTTQTNLLFDGTNGKWNADALNNNTSSYYNSTIYLGPNPGTRFKLDDNLLMSVEPMEETNILYSVYNTNEHKNTKINNLYNSIYVDGGGNLDTPITANLVDSVFLGNSCKYGYNVNDKNVLLLNSSFRISVSGFEVDKDLKITYEELKDINGIDGSLGDMVARVAAKTAPDSKYTDTTIEDILKTTNYSNSYLVTEVKSNDSTFIGAFQIESSYKNIYILDVFNITDGTYFRLYYNEYASISYDSLFDISNYELITHLGGQSGPSGKFNLYVKNSKNKKFLVKLANYPEFDDYGITLNKTPFPDTTSTYPMTKVSRKTSFANYTTNYPNDIIVLNKLITKTLNVKDKNFTAHNLSFSSMSGYYGTQLDLYNRFDNGNFSYDSKIFYPALRAECNTIDEVMYALSNQYLHKDQNNFTVVTSNGDTILDILSLNYWTLDQTITKDNFYSLDKLSQQNTLYKCPEISILKNNYNVYAKGESSFVKWGTMCNFRYDTVIKKHIADSKYQDWTNLKDAFSFANLNIDYDFIPIGTLNKDDYDKYKPFGGVPLKIKVKLYASSKADNVDINDGIFIADFFRNEVVRLNSNKNDKDESIALVEDFYAAISLYKDSYYTGAYGFYNSFIYSPREYAFYKHNHSKTIDTETITYMTHEMSWK